MSITITELTINTIIYLLMIGIGLDFIWSAYKFMKTNEIRYLPKLFGYLVFKLFETGLKKDKSNNEIGRAMFSMKSASIYMLISGIMLIINGVFGLLI